MMEYLHLFETNSARTEYEGGVSYVEPYVSLVKEDNTAHYNTSSYKKLVVATIYASNTSDPLKINNDNYADYVKSIKIDGVSIEPTTTHYTFSEIGEHTIEYEFYSTDVGMSTFYECEFKSIVIPYGMTTIGDAAFRDCMVLTSVTIPNSITSIREMAFKQCMALSSITLSNNITQINEHVFEDCYHLSSVTIPNGVIFIGTDAFNGCTNLLEIVIPSSVIEIEDNAFAYCTHCTSITVLATTPPILTGDSFNATNNCPIYVPSESVNAYKNASSWSEYTNRIQAIP